MLYIVSMATQPETAIDRKYGGVRISGEADKLLDAIVDDIKPAPTKGGVVELLIEQEAERRGIKPEQAANS